MHARQTQEQIGLFPSLPTIRGVTDAETIRLQAMQARDAAMAALLLRGVTSIGRALAAIGAALVTWPERRATYERLSRLSDRQLADIGLTRGDIARVFEPDFRMPAVPANTNQAPAAARPRAA